MFINTPVFEYECPIENRHKHIIIMPVKYKKWYFSIYAATNHW